jgi:endoglucanase
MKRFAAFASFFLLAVSLSVAETPVERYGQLAVDGNRLVSKRTGRSVQLRGMSFFWSMAGEGRDYYNADAVKWLADDWKVSVVRAAMGVDENWGAGSTGYLAGDKSGTVSNKQRVFDVVDAAIANGIYVIIDWHSHTAHQNTAKAKEFFVEMATKYGSKPNILYEIFNEPQNGGMGVAATAFWANTVKPYMDTVVAAIRAIDPANIIVIGTPTWCQDVDVAAANPVNGANLVYVQHFYSYSHKEPLRVKARAAMNTSKKPIFVSEFGVCKSDGKTPLDTAEATKWLNFLDSNKVSWVNWSVSYKDEGASALKPTVRKFDGNWTADDLTISGAYIRNKLIAASQREDNEWATSTLTTDLVVPNPPQTNGSASIAPVSAQPNKFSAGPVPTTSASGGVKFFWQGKPVTGGSLFIYDAVGNSVKSVGINGASAGDSSKRAIGSWDLTDAKGRRVTAGSYLVRGKVVTQNGITVNVSSILVVSN